MSWIRARIALVLVMGATGWPQDKDAAATDLADLSLEQLMDVRIQTATLRKQRLQDAPASVTVLTAEDIRLYGYRTLGEVLANTRSFYPTRDGPFGFTGARGFSLLGDYNTRFLVMINGHYLTDNVYGAMYMFGQDFPLDMGLVDQIEIVRGPSSALYGSNGVFGTVNIITRAPTSGKVSRVTAEVGSYGEQRMSFLTSFGVGREGKLLIAGSGFHSYGRKATFAATDTSPEFTADRIGSDQGFRTFTNLAWKNWNVTAVFGQFKTIATNGWYATTLGDSGTTDSESRNYIEAVWNRRIGETGELKWRAYYDQFRYDGVYMYRDMEGYYQLDGAAGDWVGNQLTYQKEFNRFGSITIGAEASFDVRNLQYNYSVYDREPEAGVNQDFRRSHPNAVYGVFAQQELKLRPNWTLYVGGRIDDGKNNATFLSPRIALVHATRRATSKLMYGRAFRNPSTYERYWEPNPALGPERINTFEFAHERRLFKRVNLIASVFHYRMGGLIEGVPVSESVLQFRNTSSASATGFEAEVNGNLWRGINAVGAFSTQRTRGVDSSDKIENSPVRLGTARLAVPVARDRWILSGAMRYMSSRLSPYGYALPPVTLFDATLNTRRVLQNVDLQFGLRNLFDRQYSDPLSLEHTPQVLPREGRTVFLKITWRAE